MDKIKVIVSYSWDDADKEICDKILAIIAGNSHFDVVDLKSPRALTTVEDKVTTDAIDKCDVTIGIFTKWAEGTRGGKTVVVPPPYVSGETSYAIGAYRLYPMKHVLGLYERGIDVTKHLGILSLSGAELAPFERDNFENYRKNIEDFIGQIPEKMRKLLLRPYIQRSVEKRVTIESSGMVWTENRVNLQVVKAASFEGIDHYFTLPRTSRVRFPPLKTMQATPRKDRFVSPHFYTHVLKFRGPESGLALTHTVSEVKEPPEDIETPGFWQVTGNEGRVLNFHIGFEPSKDLKDNDVIAYQYIWGLKNIYPLTKSGTRPAVENDAWLAATHGAISSAQLVLRFCHDLQFSKEPFCTLFPRVLRADVEPVTWPDETGPLPETTSSSLYRHFTWKFDDFVGTAVARWIPD